MTKKRILQLPAADPDPHEIIARIRELVQTVQGFVHLTPSYRRQINSAATLPDHFYLIGGAAIDDHECMSSIAKLNGAQVRNMLTSSDALKGLANELELLAKGVRSTAAARRAYVGERLLLAYEVAKRMNRTRSREEYIAYVDQMRDILRSRRKRRKGATEEPAPEES